jgi:pantoate--beta-alanine ligase
MQVVKTVSKMQAAAAGWLREGRRIGFVPTMGYLHAGHISLVERARKLVGPSGIVVVSIYVNPTQFAPNEDFSRYPRDLGNDLRLCRQAGVDAVFAPADTQMYPAGKHESFSTFVAEETLSKMMEGVSRPAHFRGVTTVVAKLFNIVRPDVAVFGAKDWQQATIIKRMVRDLNFPVRIVVAPTKREADGLAMSSRNKYLDGDLRLQARVVPHAIRLARALVKARGSVPVGVLKDRIQRHLKTARDARPDYIEFFEPETLEPVRKVQHGTHMALAVHIGNTRLIDNARL